MMRRTISFLAIILLILSFGEWGHTEIVYKRGGALTAIPEYLSIFEVLKRLGEPFPIGYWLNNRPFYVTERTLPGGLEEQLTRYLKILGDGNAYVVDFVNRDRSYVRFVVKRSVDLSLDKGAYLIIEMSEEVVANRWVTRITTSFLGEERRERGEQIEVCRGCNRLYSLRSLDADEDWVQWVDLFAVSAPRRSIEDLERRLTKFYAAQRVLQGRCVLIIARPLRDVEGKVRIYVMGSAQKCPVTEV